MSASYKPISLPHLLFWVGILLGVALAGGVAWADVEATFYGFPRLSNLPLEGFSCPPLLTRHDTALLRAEFTNRQSIAIPTLAQVEISTPLLAESERVQFTLAPGETRRLEWEISEKNIDLGFFIFAKLYRYPAYQQPLAESACGVLVVNLPWLNSEAALWLWVLLSLGFSLWGAWQMETRLPPQAMRVKANLPSARRLLLLILAMTLFLALQGTWLFAILGLVALILLTVAILFLSLQPA
jgi:hypothetical protein